MNAFPLQLVIPDLIREPWVRSTGGGLHLWIADPVRNDGAVNTFRAELVKAFFAYNVFGLPTSRVSPRRATYFSLRRQRNLRKRKATRLSGSLRFATGNLRCSIPAGVGRTRFAQTTAALDTASICAARPSQTGLGGKIGFGFGIGLRRGRAKRVHASPHPYSIPQPVGLGRGAQAKADQDRHLFEPKASLCLTPLLPSTAGCLERSERTQTIGSPFLWLTFLLATQKKSELLPGNPRPAGRPLAAEK